MVELKLGDCRDKLKEMESDSVDLTVTSPPYDNLRTYEGEVTWNFDIFKEMANGIEGFWGHFKRMVFGTYHFVSKAYLQRYIDEAVYRFNTKELKESARFGYMFRKALGTCYYKDVKMAA